MQILRTLSALARPTLFACAAALSLHSTVLANTSFHHLTSSEYQAHFNQRVALGGRLISLHISGGNLVKYYAGVFEYGGGPAWVASHNMTSAGYQTFYDTWKPQGFHPTILTATGSGSSARFAAVLEKNGLAGYGKHNLTLAQYKDAIDYARDHGYIPRAVTIYGAANAERFGVVFETNADDLLWLDYDPLPPAVLADQLEVYEGLGWHPIHLTISSVSGLGHVIWAEGGSPTWTASHRLTWGSFDYRDDHLVAQGFELYLIAAEELPSPDPNTNYLSSRYTGVWRYGG